MAKAKVRASCDRCGVEFDVKMLERPSPQGGIVIYFDCPKGDRFDVAYLPARAVELRDELERLRQRYAQSSSQEARKQLEATEQEYRSLYVGLAGRGTVKSLGPFF